MTCVFDIYACYVGLSIVFLYFIQCIYRVGPSVSAQPEEHRAPDSAVRSLRIRGKGGEAELRRGYRQVVRHDWRLVRSLRVSCRHRFAFLKSIKLISNIRM